ncbi:MAG: hypothetical protein EZS28_002005 [Streblomastix strix]|uniref:Uncharacterized protein n=1 Tax=Streblomastix strix TaxID=222440 RepID=A0A5J4X5I5_9EUKA|nr:MAG: hypothetical protein EZS28_002005 [Streblomastix strix]
MRQQQYGRYQLDSRRKMRRISIFCQKEPLKDQDVEAKQRVMNSHRLGNAQETAETQQSTSATDARIRLGPRRSGNEISTITLTARGNSKIDREMILYSNSEILFMYVHKHIRHDFQGKYGAATDGYD